MAFSNLIEDAIDRCDGFILVASESARQSEWVQHEVARATRLHKPFFPLLLDGGLWLSFESTQYHDVRNGKLPDEKFIDVLRRIERDRFEYFRFVAAEHWPVYRNEEYGFSFRYPGEGDFAEISPGHIQIHLPKLHGTNFDTRTLSVHFRIDDSLSSQLIKGLPVIDRSRYIHVLGLRFLRESGQDGGMQRQHGLVSYSTARQSKVVTISFHLATVDVMVFGLGPGQVVEIDREVAKEIALYVVCSFTWLD